MLDEIAEKVVSILASVKRIPPETITLESSLAELGIDSLDRINVLFELEGAFDISVPDEQARAIQTVREIVEGVRALQAGAKAAKPDSGAA